MGPSYVAWRSLRPAPLVDLGLCLQNVHVCFFNIDLTVLTRITLNN